MRYTILIVALTLLTFTNYAGSRTKTVEIKTSIACDHCNLCGSCGERIEHALYALKGVKRVDVESEKMLIRVVYNSEKTDPEQLR